MKEINKDSKKIIIEPKNSNLKKNDTTKKKIKKLTLHTLVSSKENKRPKKRVGRGAGSKRGKTSTFGHKGQRSRSGHKIGSKFEGGQMPFYRRIPKLRGFKQHNTLVYQVVNLKDINDRNIINVTNQTLFDANLIRSLKGNVKILGEGEIKHKISVEVSSISESARNKVLALSGEVKLI